MALWAGTSINSNETASLYNKIADRMAIPMVVKANPLLYAFLGKNDETNRSVAPLRHVKSITGLNYEVTLLGALATPAAVADGSAELAASTASYDADRLGGAEFAIAHYALTFGVPNSELDRFAGSEYKLGSYVKEHAEYMGFSYEKVLSTAIHADVAPSRAAFGGWQYAVDDGGTYGTIDRTDAANADFRGLVNDTFGEVTLDKLNYESNRARANMGKVSIGVAGTTLFSKLQNLVQGYSQATYSPDAAMFGSPHVVYSGIKWLLDANTTAGIMGMFDPRWWDVIRKTVPFTSSGMILDPGAEAAHIVKTQLWMQNVCRKPNANIKLSAVT